MTDRLLRIAVASTNGDTVDQHLGRTNRLFVFEASAVGPVLMAQRCLPQWDGICGHGGQRVAEILHWIEDCSVVVANQVGPGLHARLASHGIHVLISDQKVDAVLERIGRSYLARNIHRKERES